MIIRTILFSVLICVVTDALSQELVTNGDFDIATQCPPGNSVVDGYCDGWFRSFDDPNVNPQIIPTPDFFHSCATVDAMTPPLVFTGFQEPFVGRGYLGVITYDALNTNYREVVGTMLAQPLVVGDEYYVSFRLVSAAKEPTANAHSNGFGVKFSTNQTWNSVPELINNQAHFTIEEIITDTVEWQQFTFAFTADSAYQFVHFGNFYRDWLVDTLIISGTGRTAYYFLDDVQVSTDPLSTSSGDGLFLTLSPNPVHDILEVNCSGSREIREVEILSVSGVKVFRESNRSRRLRLNIENLSEGIYLVKIVLNDGATLVKRIIKI